MKKLEIAKRYLVPKQIKDNGLKDKNGRLMMKVLKILLDIILENLELEI
jgi:ATP-dependent Lon protease